jgi:hypothetical protein
MDGAAFAISRICCGLRGRSSHGGRHEHSVARAERDHDGQDDGGDKEPDRGGDDNRPSPCASPTPPPLIVTPTVLAIDCMVSKFATLTVAGTPAGLTAVVADPLRATVGAPTVVNGNATFVVTGLGTLQTTIALADTAGATASVTVTLTHCPWIR